MTQHAAEHQVTFGEAADAVPWLAEAAKPAVQYASERKLDSVQILRGLAALTVVFWHSDTAIWFIEDRLHFPEGELQGVSLFFVISGFIICHIGLREGLTVREFAAKRFVRIYPIFWLFTLAVIALHHVQPSMIFARNAADYENIVCSLLILPQQGYPVLGVGWTLEHEILFYALFAALMAIGAQRRVLEILCMLGLAGMVLRLNGPIRFWDWHLLSPLQMQFAAGVFVYRFQKPLSRFSVKMLLTITVLSFISARLTGTYGSASAVNQTIVGDTSSWFPIIASGVAFGALLAAALRFDDSGTYARHMVWRRMTMIGDASFTLYLSHQFVLIAFGKVSERMLVSSPWYVAELYRVVAICAAVLTAMWIYSHIERPILRRMQRVISRAA